LECAKKQVAKEVTKEEVSKRSNKAFRVVIRAAKKAKVTRGNKRCKEY
jgi:hypothetical protein